MVAMKLRILPAAALLLFACDQSAAPTAPGEMPPAAESANPDRVTRVDGSNTIVGCNGDIILVENHEQIVTAFVGTATHGHLQLHIIELNSTATDLTTGEVLRVNGALNETANGDFTSETSPGEFNLSMHQTYIGSGGREIHVVLTVHVTINPNGALTVNRFVASQEC
jgi:hypothetical protein